MPCLFCEKPERKALTLYRSIDKVFAKAGEATIRNFLAIRSYFFGDYYEFRRSVLLIDKAKHSAKNNQLNPIAKRHTKILNEIGNPTAAFVTTFKRIKNKAEKYKLTTVEAATVMLNSTTRIDRRFFFVIPIS